MWASAGHLPPLLREGGESRYLSRGDGLIGLEDIEYRNNTRILESQTLLIMFTDGLVERRGESLDVGLERLARAVASGPDQPDRLCEHVLTDVLQTERQLHDDVTAVIVKVQ